MKIKTRKAVEALEAERSGQVGRNISYLMKKSAIKARNYAEEATNREHENAEAETADEAEYNAEEAASAVRSAAERSGNSYRKARQRIKTRGSTDVITIDLATEENNPAPGAFGRAGKASRAQSSGGTVKTIENQQKAAASRGRERIKTAEAARKNAAATAKAIRDKAKEAQFRKQAAEKARTSAKSAAKALKRIIQAAINAVKSLTVAIAGGGIIALVIVIVVCLAALIAASAYGIFAGNDVGDGRDLRTAVNKINAEYYEKIQNIRNSVDNLGDTTITINGEVGGMTGVWQDVLAVYAVDTSHGAEAVPAIDFDESKTEHLRSIFNNMVELTYKVTKRTVEEEQEVTDESGVTLLEPVEVIYRDVHIYVTTKSVSEAAAMYSFTPEQNNVLAELMSDKFSESWSGLIYGYSYGDEGIVAVALSQIGNVGGEPYWRWYGLSSRTEWCAIFVSWCADQCGYLDGGIVPNFAWVPDGVSWFQSRGQWQPGGYTPAPGNIIFFDWDGDGRGNHVGIVEYAENGVVHTIEGNSGDSCRKKEYAVNNGYILGYGQLCI